MEIPGFQIKDTIGRGGMATVYLAIQESLDRQVVLKTLHQEETENPAFAERFLNEARIIAALRHPHIITIYDVGSTEEMIYISMEYVEGGDLKSRLKDRMAPEEVLDMMAKVGSALDFAHREGVIHRDVKPANILYRRDGTPLLSDFGIAKRVQVDSELTSTGTILGSPFYMSPEQAEGAEVDGRTDIYSLGIICYEMLTGRRPYDGDSAIKVIMQHMQAPLPELPPDLERFGQLVKRMIAKKRDERFADAAELIACVKRLQERELLSRTQEREALAVPPAASTESGPEATGARTAAFSLRTRRGRIVFLSANLLIILLGFGSFYLWVQSMERPRFVTRPPPQPAGAAATSGEAGGEVAPAPAPGATPAPLREDVVTALEWLAEHSLEEDRLTEPPADNAHYYYSRLLALDPDNEAAQEGFDRIAERYVELAEERYASRDYKQAQAYITLGLQVQPNNEGLHQLQQLIDDREKSILDWVFDAVRGSG